MTAIRTRRTQADDEYQINDLYNHFSGNTSRGKPRPLEHMRWVWQNAPGGPVDSWVIEAQQNATWKVVGHHGLCPVRFTYASQDWLCAKTMHTFLLPEYRDQFLYLRFEQECLREADTRYDAIYSVNPGTGRLRSALGYQSAGTWIHLERVLQPLHLIYRSMVYLAGRISPSARASAAHAIASFTAAPGRRSPLELEALSAEDAISSRFFAEFWGHARPTAGMAPRRDSADLAWRYWKRPGFKGTTLTCTWPDGGSAYCVVDTNNPLMYLLTDFFVTQADPQKLESLLDSIFAWCAGKGALSLRYNTTTKGLPGPLLEVCLRKMKPWTESRLIQGYELPRRFTPGGNLRLDGEIPDWNASEFLQVC